MVQLHQSQQDFDKLNTQILIVFREDKKLVECLKIAANKAKSTFPILNDLGAKETTKYSTDGFHTYLIDTAGTIKAISKGKKYTRPMSEVLISEIKKLGE